MVAIEIKREKKSKTRGRVICVVTENIKTKELMRLIRLSNENRNST